MAHEFRAEGVQRQHLLGEPLAGDALQLLAVPIAGGEAERGDRHAGRLVHVHLALGIVAFDDGVDPLHHRSGVEEGGRLANAAVRAHVPAAVLLVGAAPGLGSAVEVHAVDAVLVDHLLQVVGDKILPLAAVADDVRRLVRLRLVLPLVSAPARMHQAPLVILVPLGSDGAHLVAVVEKELHFALVARLDQLAELLAVRRLGIGLDVGPVLVEADGADAQLRQPVEQAVLQTVAAHVTDAVVPHVGLGGLHRRGLKTERVLQRLADRLRLGDQVHSQHHGVGLAPDLDHLITLGVEEVAVRLAEPGQPPPLVAQPHERLEGPPVAVLRQGRRIEAASPTAGPKVQILAVLRTDGDLQGELVDGYLFSGRQELEIRADHPVVLHAHGAFTAKAFGIGPGGQLHDVGARFHRLGARPAPSQLVSVGLSREHDRRGEDVGIAGDHGSREGQVAEAVGSAPHTDLATRHFHRRPRGQDLIGLACVAPQPLRLGRLLGPVARTARLRGRGHGYRAHADCQTDEKKEQPRPG